MEDAKARVVEGTPLVSVCVSGNLDFGPAEFIQRDIVIVNSIITGGFSAQASNFSGSLNLRGTNVIGAVQLDNSLFEEDVIFHSASFGSALSARGAQFRRLLALGSTVYSQDVDFVDALFFGPVDARAATFRSGADFSGTTFSNSSVFDLAIFKGPTSFEGAIFAGDADFSGVTFESTSGNEGCAQVILRGATASGAVSLRGADIGRHIQADSIRGAEFDLESAKLRPDVRLFLNDIAVQGLQLDLEYVERIVTFPDGLWNEKDDNPLSCENQRAEGEERKDDLMDALSLIENTASRNEDLQTASAAEFRRLQVRARQLSQPFRSVVVVIGEWLFGYFIRPLRPLVVLVFWLPLIFGSQLVLQRPLWRTSLRHRAWEFTSQSLWKLPWRHLPNATEFRGGPRLRQVAVFVSGFESIMSSALLAAIVVGAARTIPITKEILNAF